MHLKSVTSTGSEPQPQFQECGCADRVRASAAGCEFNLTGCSWFAHEIFQTASGLCLFVMLGLHYVPGGHGSHGGYEKRSIGRSKTRGERNKT